MVNYKSIYICYSGEDWILKILADDIYNGAIKMGLVCNRGPLENYGGEDICYHMWWRYTVPIEKAKVNAVFITHTDDVFKEKELLSIKDKFDIFIPMSPEDEQFLIELGFDKNKVFGINLPVRNQYVRPMSIGIFSRWYSDKRKNEQWLLDYCRNHPDSKYVCFVFIGQGWGDFVSELSSYGCSFQWINVSRKMPYEYMYQQLELSRLDYYLYMGLDGGAMGAYDAYAMGVKLCITDDGYHKGIPDMDYSFVDKEGFEKQMDKIIGQQVARVKFYSDNSVDNYVKKIIEILDKKTFGNEENAPHYTYSVIQKRRKNYYPKTRSRRYTYFMLAVYKWIKYQLVNR